MKRLPVILLLLLYTASVSGATLNLHFCGERLQKISLAGFGHNDCCCGKKNPVKTKGCCQDHLLSVKIDGHHQQAMAAGVPHPAVNIAPAVATQFIIRAMTTGLPGARSYHGPPRLRAGTESLLVQHCVFRI